jgi:uncharacterized protein DUF6677
MSSEKKGSEPAQHEPPAFPPQGNPVVAAVLAWMVYGLGHWYLGKRWKAVVLFVLLSATWVTAMAMGSFLWFTDEEWRSATYRFLLFLAPVGFFWSGLYYFAALLFLDPAGALKSPTYEVGWVAAICASLLNCLAVVDAWDIARGKKG